MFLLIDIFKFGELLTTLFAFRGEVDYLKFYYNLTDLVTVFKISKTSFLWPGKWGGFLSSILGNTFFTVIIHFSCFMLRISH